jgi:hypothetical protein
MSRTLAPFALAFVLCAGVAAAASAAEEEVSCVDQIAALCPDTEPNSPQRRACVKEKRSKLSADCQKKLGPPTPPPAPGAATPPDGDIAKLQEMRPFFEACGPDREAIGKRCTGEKGQGTPLLQCIVDHKSEMSQKCVDVAQKQLAPPKPATTPAPAK